MEGARGFQSGEEKQERAAEADQHLRRGTRIRAEEDVNGIFVCVIGEIR
jgi:hypothetical protein